MKILTLLSPFAVYDTGAGSSMRALARLVLLGICAVAVSACMSQSSVLDLTTIQPSATIEPVTHVAKAMDAETGEAVVDAEGNAMMAAVPLKAQRSAAVQAPTDTNQLAAIPDETLAEPSQDAIQEIAETDQATLESSLPEVADANVEVAALVPEPVAQPSTKRQSIFARFFAPKSRTARAARIRPAANRMAHLDDRRGRSGIVLASTRSSSPEVTRIQPAKTNTNSASTGAALPGVKSNAELFGINNAEIEEGDGSLGVAVLGGFGRISPNGLRLQHDKVEVACLKPGIIRIIQIVGRKYGKKPIVTSGYRSPKRNQRAGGARNSTHIYCMAVDLQVDGVSKWDLAKYLRSLPGRGGVGTYCRTRSVHVDTGTKRDWHHPCRRSSVKKT